ncbi:MAG: serpin family protein [Polyangiaceae bacterium]
MLRKITALSLLAFCAACGGEPAPPVVPPPTTARPPIEPSASAQTDAGATADTSNTPAMTTSPGNVPMQTSIEAFNSDLYSNLKSAKGNIFYSPTSIELALAMTAAGAKGTTLSQMQSTLHLSNDMAATGQSASSLLATWGTPQQKGPTLAIANRLWAQQGYALQPDYLQNTNKWYGADVGQLDFKKSADASRKTINTWVSDKTNKKIPDLLPSGSITASTRLVLTNAVYFKGAWRTTFDKKLTKAEAFKAPAGNVQAQMMHTKLEHGSYADVGDAEVLAIPYAGDASHRLSMLVVLPKAGKTTATVEGEIDPNEVSKWASACSEASVNLSLPRFKTTGSFELSAVLKQMGMPAAFGADADFSGIAQKTEDPLYISAVVHKAFVDVNEEGTEAAAATGVVMRAMAATLPPKTVDFKVDHPFLFFIRDDASGTVLFAGRIEDPTK